ncbi:MAG: CxxxxCH/CxxCH domain-containing protein [Pseudomonadota bacterium]
MRTRQSGVPVLWLSFLGAASLLLSGCSNSKLDTTASNDSKLGLCSACHGSESSPGPPRDLNGDTSTALRGIGAHEAHLLTAAIASPTDCSECHVVPSGIMDANHMDGDLRAEVIFGTVATTGGALPSWDGSKCTNTYCHGATLGGGTKTTPAWTTVDGTQAACGNCHSLPPPAPHTDQTACETCHSTVAGPGQVIINKNLHVNGNVDVATACGSCHLIPPDIGQHQRSEHVDAGCAACHGTGYSSTTVRAADHINGVKNVGGSGSRINSWNGSTCSSTCHGSESWLGGG